MGFLVDTFYSLVVAALILIVLTSTGLLGRAWKYISASTVYKMMFASMIGHFMVELEHRALRHKKTLFAPLSQHLREREGDLLEIGIGGGSNFDHYPDGTSIVALDYNPHMEAQCRKKIQQYPKLKLKSFVIGSMTDMKSVPNNSVVAVVSTCLLCSSSDKEIKDTMNEIKRVLKPGGLYFFFEHVIDKPGTFRRRVQRFLSSWTKLWPVTFDGCMTDRELWRPIEEASFKHVSYEFVYGDRGVTWEPIASMVTSTVNCFICGTAGM